MKKKLFVTIVLVLVLSLFLVSCTSVDLNIEKSNKQLDLGSKAYENLEALSQNYANRNLGTEESNFFINSLKDYMLSLGYESEVNNFVFSYSILDESGLDYIDATSSGKNLVCKKSSANSKGTLVFSCYYDNMYTTENMADGAYESGAAIAALMALSEYFKELDLGYDIEFAFLDAGEYMWQGANEYLSSLDKDDVKLVINYGPIIGGDNLYIYSRDKKTTYNDYFYEVALKNNLNIKNIPSNKNIISATLTLDSVLDYCHVGMFGNQYYCIQNSIPSVSYLSLNWEDNNIPGFVEVKGENNVFQTNEDKFNNLVTRCGSKEKMIEKFNVVLNSTIFAVTENQETFDNVLKIAYDEDYSSFIKSDKMKIVFAYGTKILLVGIIFAVYIACRYYVSNHKEIYAKDIKEAQEEINKMAKDMMDKMNGDNMNNTQDIDEDIFRDGDENKKDKSTDDDIFE